MPWFYRTRRSIPSSREDSQRVVFYCCSYGHHRCSRSSGVVLKLTLVLVLLSAYCILLSTTVYAHNRESPFQYYSTATAFVTNQKRGYTNNRCKQQQRSPRRSSIIFSTTEKMNEQSPNSNGGNKRMQQQQKQQLLSKSKIDSQIKQLEKHQQQQQQQRYHRKKNKGAVESSSSSSSSSSSKKQQQKQQHGNNKSSNKRKATSRKNNKHKNRCSKTQNKKRHLRHLYTKAKNLEKQGAWREASNLYEYIVTKLDKCDAHSYLAWGRLESRRERGVGVGNVGVSSVGEEGLDDNDDDKVENDIKAATNKDDENSSTSTSKASTIFRRGTQHCPTSTHLYHGWAIHEQYTLGNTSFARQLLQTAYELDPYNGYVCHAYGLLEYTIGGGGSGSGTTTAANNEAISKAKSLWQEGLIHSPSAALVCSLGDMYIASGDYHSARELYMTYLPKLSKGRERTEVYLAAASLEERVYDDVEKAAELLRRACAEGGNGSLMDGRAYVALARLGTSGGLVDDAVVKKRLKEICMRQLKHNDDNNNNEGGNKKKKKTVVFPVNDGRLFNAWAKLESKTGNLSEARKILGRGIELYPKDYTLLQAAGNIEDRLGNIESARDLYGASLSIEPSAPTLIAYALLELRSPIDAKASNITMVRKLFEEALLIDPKHGPAYNAFGNLERRQGNVEYARQIYENGIKANCTDAPSVYHGLAKLYLSLGEIEEARNVLQRGLDLFKPVDNNTLVQRNENVAFLAHTLAMIDLNVNSNAKHAKDVVQQGLWHCRNSPQLLLAMALCESRLGNDLGARDMFERSLMADQTHAQAWQAFGVMEMRSGNFRSAKLLFECGLKNSPTHGALWQAYGTLESWKGNVGTARILFAAGIEKCPNHVSLYQAWACLELRDGDVITAKRLISEALTRDKRNGSGWLVAAQIEEKMGNQGLVGLILRRGIECAPGDMELYRALAEHEISRGKIDSARELLEKGIEINPLHAPLYHSLAELEARVFNIEGLAKLNKRAAEIFQSDANAPPTDEAMKAMKQRIKHGRTTKMPDGITALAEKIGVESDESTTIAGVSMDEVDLDSLVNNVLCGFGEQSGMMLE